MASLAKYVGQQTRGTLDGQPTFEVTSPKQGQQREAIAKHKVLGDRYAKESLTSCQGAQRDLANGRHHLWLQTGPQTWTLRALSRRNLSPARP